MSRRFRDQLIGSAGAWILVAITWCACSIAGCSNSHDAPPAVAAPVREAKDTASRQQITAVAARLDVVLEAYERERLLQIEQYTTSLAGREHEAQQWEKHGSGPRLKEANQLVADLKERLTAIKRGQFVADPVIRTQLAVGSIGKFVDPAPEATIVQIQGDQAALIFFRYFDLAANEERSVSLLLRGVPVGSLADGSQIKLDGVYEVPETFRYTVASSGAPRTALVLEPIDTKSIRAIFKSQKSKQILDVPPLPQ